ncbi:MAG: substrate-binding domain-containing protein [Fischerella sp.]|nr:substrate-binding domain-containing protein [Fischerella sp.]
MSKYKSRSVDTLTSIGLGTLITVALLWSVGLIGNGLWQLIQRSEIHKIQSQEKPPKTFTEARNVTSGVIRYGGSTAWAPIRLLVDSVIRAERPEFQLRYVEPNNDSPGSTTGIRMLLADQLSFVQTSRPLLPEEYKQAKQRGFQLKQIPVAVDAIVVAVHPDLNLRGLTLEKLRAIYSGRIVNWRELGGPNLKITPYSRPVSAGSSIDFFLEDILGGQKFGSNVEFISTTTEALRLLANNPGSIYYDSAPLVVPQCHVKPLPLAQEPGKYISPYQEPFVPSNQCPKQRNKLNLDAFRTGRYPITRYLYVVVKQNGGFEERAGKDYVKLLLTNQGQELLTKAGFVRIQ